MTDVFDDFESYDVPEPDYYIPESGEGKTEEKEKAESSGPEPEVKAEAETGGPEPDAAKEESSVSDLGLVDLPQRMVEIENPETKVRAMVPSGIQWKFVDLEYWFENEPPELDEILPGGFITKTVGGLVSAGGTGKSFLAVEMAAAIAAVVAGSGVQEGNLLGLPISKGGKVAVLAKEDPPEVIWQRVYRMSKHWGPEVRSAIRKNLKILPCTKLDIDISSSSWLKEIMYLAEGSRLIILDTLTRFHGLNENETCDAKIIMRGLESIAEDTEAGVMYLHHVNKLSAMSGMAELQQAARGSGVFVDNARWTSFLAGMTKDEARANEIELDDRWRYVRWNTNKVNYGPGSSDYWFQRIDGGVLVPSDIDIISVEEAEERKQRAKQRAKDREGKTPAPRRRVTKRDMANPYTASRGES